MVIADSLLNEMGWEALANLRLDEIGRLRAGSAVPVEQWKIVEDEPVLIYVVHTNAEFEKDEKRRQEDWEGWTVGRWIKHNGGGWMYYGMIGKVTHVAPLPPPPGK